MNYPDAGHSVRVQREVRRMNAKRIKYIVTVDYSGPDDQVVDLSIKIGLKPINESPVMRLVSVERMDEA